MICKSILCLLAFGISLLSAQLCPLVLPEGECVSNSSPCPMGKIQSDTFNCGSSTLQCCYTPAPEDLPEPPCGSRSPISRIFNGKDVLNACKWPWAVQIRTRLSGNNDPPGLSNTYQSCNGVLVRPDIVLTSACCIQTASLLNGNRPANESLLVIAGDYNVDEFDFQGTSLREKFVTVNKAYIHPGNFKKDVTTFNISDLYDDLRADYNIGVLKLEYPVDLGDCIELACLPSMDDITNLSPNELYSLPCHIASWGRHSTSVDNSVILRDAPFNIYPEPICNLIDPSFRSGSTCGRTVQGSMQGVCSGDDGGMVICEDPNTNKYKLFGMINFCKTEGCIAPVGNELVPISNLREQSTMSWINDIIQGNV
ncbi:hypothetical protein LOTGIDRAFT_229780, partial [Lottia gigantea]